MDKDLDNRKNIIKLLATKSVTKYKAFDTTESTFDLIKKQLKELAEDVKSELVKLGEDIPVVYKEKGKYEVGI